MILVTDYIMGRDLESPLDMQQARNMSDLLSRVNWLFGTLEIHARVSSGYRTPEINKKVSGSKNSAHLTCQAVDLIDNDGNLALKILDHLDLVEECGLYIENPEHTPGWLHIQSRKTKSGKIVFNP